MSRHSRTPAFTIIELLVVLSIFSLLVALLMPAVQYARESARRTVCQNNLKQIGLALLMRHDSHKALPAGWLGWEGNRHEVSAGPGWGWAALLLPQLEQQPLADKFNLHNSVLDPSYEQIRSTVLPAMVCPSDISNNKFELKTKNGKSLGTFPKSNYVANFGGGRLELCASLSGTGKQCMGEPYEGLFFHNSDINLADLSIKGASNTIFVGERHSQPLPKQAPVATWVGALWEADGDFHRVLGTAMHTIITNPNTGNHTTEFLDFSSRHGSEGVYFVFADGHVDMLTKQMNDWLFVQMMTRFLEDDLPEVVVTEPAEPIVVIPPSEPVIPPFDPVDPPTNPIIVPPRQPIVVVPGRPGFRVPPRRPRERIGCPVCGPRLPNPGDGVN